MSTKQPLDSLCTLIVDCEHKTAPLADEGYPSIRTPNIGRGRLLLDGVNRVDEATYREWTKRAVPEPGDLIIAREAPVGNVAIVPPGLEACLGQRTVLVRPDPRKVDARFLCYFMLGDYVQGRFRAAASGATVPHLNMRDIRNLPVPPLPSLAQQRRIGSTLGAYDDLIEVNRRRIAVLEEMARRLFEEWFVQADDRAPAADTAVSTWRESTVGEVIRFVRGRSYRSADLAESGGLPFVSLKCILRDGGFRRNGVKRYVGEYKPEQILRVGDIVVAVTDMTQDRRIVGQAALIPKSEEPAAVMSMDLVKAVPSASLDRLFCYYWLRFSGFAAQAAQHANGANVLHLSPAAMAGLPIRVPALAQQERFSRLVQPITEHAQVLALVNEKLARSRDLLLPRLISGDLPVTAAERELESVA